MSAASFFPTWMFSRHVPSGNKKCVRTEHKTDHNDHDLTHGYLCNKNSNLCSLCALLFKYLVDQTFLLNSNTTVLCTLRLLSSELSINHFPSQVFSHLHLLWYYRSFIFSVILSVWNFPSVELFWYYGYHFLSNFILDCPISVFFDIGS